jgi:hypothetical protein
MGSHPTLAHRWVGQPTTRDSATGAELAFKQLNGHLAPFIDHGDPDGNRERVRTVEDLDTRSDRSWVNDANENPPTPIQVRQLQLQQRATAAQTSTRQLEHTFDRPRMERIGANANRAEVPPYSAGRRAPPCVPKDGEPLGTEGHAALPPHLGWPPTLPRRRDPGAGGNAVRAIRRPAAHLVFLGTLERLHPWRLTS